MIRYFILFQIYAPGGSTEGNASMKVGAFFLSTKVHELTLNYFSCNISVISWIRYCPLKYTN